MGYRFHFQDMRLVGALQFHFVALQLHSIARSDAGRIAREGVNLPVFLVGDGQPVLSGVDTPRNC